MKLIEFFSSLTLFIFLALLFPTFNDAVYAASITGPTEPLIKQLPLVFLLLSILPIIYFALKESK